MKILILFFFIVLAQCQISTNTMTGTHINSGCQLSTFYHQGQIQNWISILNTTAFPNCPSSYTGQSSGSNSPTEQLVCVVSDSTISVNLLIASTYNWKILSQLPFPYFSAYINTLDTYYGLTNVSLITQESDFPIQCYNNTAQTISIYGFQSCIAVPSLIYYNTYCEYDLVQTSIDGYVYMRSLKTSINYYNFAYFLPGIWNSTQSNFVLTSV
jgi:hypothetical protein